MATLDEIDRQWDDFYAAVRENLGVVTPELEAQHEVLQLLTKDKVDGYYWQIKRLEALCQHRRVIELEVENSRKSIEKQIAWLRERVQRFMASKGATALDGERFTCFKLQGAGGKQAIEILVHDPKLWPQGFLKTVLDEEAVRFHFSKTDGDLLLMNGKLLAQRKPRGTVLRLYAAAD